MTPDPRVAESTTLRSILERYIIEVSPRKRSAHTEISRIKALMRRPICHCPLSLLSSSDLATYRDDRLKTVAHATVTKELNSLSHAIDTAMRDWGIVGLLRQYKAAPADVRGTLAAMLRWMARDLERYVVPGVSRAAQARADELELGDLAKFHWGHQRAAMKDPTREIFHWEHVVPVSDIVQALVALEDPIPSTIVPILMRAEIAWILKAEDKRLRRKGRPDPRAAYVAAGIDLLAWSQSANQTADTSQPVSK